MRITHMCIIFLTWNSLSLYAMDKTWLNPPSVIEEVRFKRLEYNMGTQKETAAIALFKELGTLTPQEFDERGKQAELSAREVIIKVKEDYRRSKRNCYDRHHDVKIKHFCPIQKAIHQSNEALVNHLLTHCDIDKKWHNEHYEPLAVIALEKLANYQGESRKNIALAVKNSAPCAPHELALCIIKAQNMRARKPHHTHLARILEACSEEDLKGLTQLHIEKLPAHTESGVKRLVTPETLDTPIEQLINSYKKGSHTSEITANTTTLGVRLTKEGTTRIKLSCPLSRAIKAADVHCVTELASAENVDLYWANHKRIPLTLYALQLAVSTSKNESDDIKAARFEIAKSMLEKAPLSPAQWAYHLAQLINKRKFKLVTICCNEGALTHNELLPLAALMCIKANDSDECLNAFKALINNKASLESTLLFKRKQQCAPYEIAQKRSKKIPKIYAYLQTVCQQQAHCAP